MRVTDFNYELPEKLIAKYPPKVRGSSRLLVLNKSTGHMQHAHYSDLDKFLSSGDLIVRNDTQVIKARLQTKNQYGKTREILLLEEHGNSNPLIRKALYRGSIKPGDQLSVNEYTMTVNEVLEGGTALIESQVPMLSIAEKFGDVPLPPYMHRDATKSDEQRYQTVFADKAGSVAAPTASLNFTKRLESKLKQKSIQTKELTLHVGLGTFLPIRSETLEDHEMHSEYFVVPKSTISAISSVKRRQNKVIALGTTVTRTLEFCSEHLTKNTFTELSGEANIFIYPGYKFKAIDAMLTNFHAPKSTVLMMAAAFAGWDNLHNAYQEAIKENYKFLSYGDSMLIL